MKVNRSGQPETVEVTADGEGSCSQAGALLLTNLCDRLGLTDALTEALAPTRRRRSAHDDGEILRDLIVTLVQGGEHVSDLAALRDQPGLFGDVASDSPCFQRCQSSLRSAAVYSLRFLAIATPSSHLNAVSVATRG